MMNLKKVFALFLTLCMVLSVVPFAAWAEEETDVIPELETEEPAHDPIPENTEPEPVLPEELEEPAESAVVADELPEQVPPAEQPAEKPEENTEKPETKEDKAPEYLPPKVLANGGEYQSLSEALADLGDGEFEVIFLSDLSDSAVVGKKQNITLIMTDCSFSGEIINYGKLTVFGSESGFDGCIITRAYCEKDEDGNVVDEASGETVIEDGCFNGELIVEQKATARVNGDALPKLTLNSGRFGVDLTKRYLNWDEDEADPEYSASAGKIEITGGVYFTDPSAYVAEGYAAYANDGWWLVGPETHMVSTPDGTPVMNPEIPALSDGAFANVFIENEEPSGYQPVQESVSAEEQLEKQTQKIVSIDVDINITGNGSVVFEGDEYGKGSTLKFAAYSEPVLEIKPAENWKIYNVTVGSNGSATQYGTADTIQLPALEGYATVNVIFAENPAANEASNPGNVSLLQPNSTETSEIIPETENKPINLVEVAVNITGDGSVLHEGKEYKNKESLNLPEYSSPEFTIQPAENWKIYNVTVGSNGSSTPYGTENEIKIEALSHYSTINVIFAEMKPEEIEALKAQLNETEEKTDGQTDEQPEVETLQKSPMLTASRPMLSSARPPLGSSPVLGGPKPEEYNITYETNGGEFVTGYTPTKTYTYDDVVALPTKDNIKDVNNGEFAGWFLKQDLSGNPVSTIKNSKTDLTLYAKWKYTISIDVKSLNGGTGEVQLEDGSLVSDPSQTYNLVAYTNETVKLVFCPDDGSVVDSVLINGVSGSDLEGYSIDKVSKNENVQVSFDTAPICNVVYDYAYDSKTESSPEPLNKVIVLPTPARNGYTFSGWKDSIKSETYAGNSKYKVVENVTFTAQWKPIEYYITYVTNGGDPIDRQAFSIESDIISLPTPKYGDAEFLGWYTDSTLKDDTTKISTIDPKTQLENITVYAKWPSYTVKYVYNDGATADLSNDVKYGTTLTLPSRTRSGYDFKGWKCSADGKVYPAYTQYPVKSDVTFTAQWEKQKVYYKVSVYHTNNGAVYYNGQPLVSGASFELEEGETAALKFAATASGYYVYNCTVNNVRRGSVEGLTVGPIKENTIISVTFAPTFVRPITGDANHLMLWACLMAASALGIAGIPLLRKKRRTEK